MVEICFEISERTSSAFKNGIGANFHSVANPHQPGNPYCLTCTCW